jgi:acyl-CoA synthetase (AMP-forming)/AMP-acid ligase II
VSREPVEILPFGDVLVRAAQRWPDRVAVAFPDRRLTASELLDEAYRVARGLHALGLRRGERVGIVAPNCVEYHAALFGGALLGVEVVTVNARFRATELAYVFSDAALAAVLTSDVLGDEVDFVGLLRGAMPHAPSVRHAVMLGQSSPEGFVDRAELDRLADTVSDEIVHTAADRVRVRDVAIMMYTSGTTAQPKGCPLTHESIVRTGQAMVTRFDLTGDDVWWNPLPMFHLSSILPLTAALLVGSRFATMVDFEPGAALAQVERERVTFLWSTFPTVTQELVGHPDFASTDLATVRLVNQVAPPDMQRALQRALPGAVQVSAYGCTELGGIAAMNDPAEDAESRATTCGPPFPGVELRIVDPETGEFLPTGERGEIVGRGPGMFEGYHNDAPRNAEAIDADGFFHTGDVGSLDEAGNVSFHGRTKDMLKVGGENVACLEIESFLATHPAVRLAQVVGIPDARLVEVPAAFVQLEPGHAATEDELIEYFRGQVASFRIPRHVRFVEEWPMSATKVQKFRLREQLVAELGLE